MIILIIEDERDIRKTLKNLLKSYYPNWEIQTAPSLKGALSLLKRKDFSLILSDCLLPDGMACDLFPWINCPLIIMTGYVDPQKLRNATTSLQKPFRVLKKPFTFFELLQTIREILKADTPEYHQISGRKPAFIPSHPQ